MDEFESPISDLSLVSDTVAIQVGTDGVGGVQLCPALLLGSPQALPGASKHIYSRLAANAHVVDEGMPDLILGLISNANQMSAKYLAAIESALTPFVSSCGLWLVSSGEHCEPLPKAAMNTIKNVLPQTDNSVEVLHLIVNSQEVVGIQSTYQLVDTSINTLLILSRLETTDDTMVGKFRAQACVRLGHPPPALLIGVPSEHVATGMTPTGQAPPVLLSPSNDKHPLSIAIFAGASLSALEELLVYVEKGTAVIVLQDSCELCAILYNATLLYRTAQFEHHRFVDWLTEQLQAISMTEVDKTVDLIVRIFGIALGDPQLVDFVESSQLHDLCARVVDMSVQCYSGTTEARQIVLLAARLNQPNALAAIDIEEIFDDELWTSILCECVKHDNRIEFISAVLESHPQLNVTSDMLIKMLQNTDQHYFNTVVLGQCMGYSTVPDEIDDRFALDLSKVLRELSCGIDDLFPMSCFNGDVLHRDNAASIKTLAIWCLLLHKPCLVRCLCAFSEEPLAFSLVLSRIARSLSHQARDWFFYEESLVRLADNLASAAVSVLNTVHVNSPHKAYQMLCQPLEGFHGQTITQIAFQSNIRGIVSHECCQKWVHRLLYGNLQPRSIPYVIPNWTKILLSAILILPIKWWMLVRPFYLSQHKEEKKSPTVALLDSSRQPKRTRAVSTYSVISGRSDALTTITAPLSLNFPPQVNSGGDSATPQSMVFPLNIEEPDGENSMRFVNKKTKIRRWASPSFSTFYSTPIVKYWLSLVFRLLHICLLAYSVLLPGCGSLTIDTLVWAWSFMWWMESVWVLNVRAQTTDFSSMPWRVFDVIVVFLFLSAILVLKIFGDGIVTDTLYISSVYYARVVSSFFLLYWCYSTLFFYIPLSNIYGPLMVRVKMMVLRDFTNFLILIALVMASSAASIQAILYPDREFSFSVVWSSLSWAFLSLFTTDLSSLKESESCKKSFLGSPKDYCNAVGEYGNPTCPSQTLPAYVVVVEYLVLLKLISWPLLFAFFAKTAKAVEDEADKIWKYQLYSLATDFSIRPALPPPLTPIFFIFVACCQAKGKLFGLSFNSIDHPDIPRKDRPRTTARFGSVYRNPSVPHKKNEFMNNFWRKMAIAEWRSSLHKGKTSSDDKLKDLENQIRMISLRYAYKKSCSEKKEMISYVPYGNTSINRILVPSDKSSWNILLPRYFPPFYCKPVEEFPTEMARIVEIASEQNVCELRRCWRNRQVQEQNCDQPANRGWLLSSAGFPLNPNGRRGIAGRGNHPKFGANKRSYYIILSGSNKEEIKLLLDDRRNLPNEMHPEGGPRDEQLARILRLIGLSESDAQVFSMRRLDTSIASSSLHINASDTSPTHIAVDIVEDADDTDNAWTEHDVWAVALRNRKVSSSILGYSWIPVTSTSISHLNHAKLIKKSLKIYDLD